ncbi:hypothetical protein [Francisella adeliensis]|uniref:Phosphate starvation-inducible protein PsiF n=1 Tax=Francisella adeliensis TaxID=2007306 RepID=A0A2Z4Y013_9GAMM|nr:hypothetical protein [Francisella adeliensis]AXA34374.1 hypothetical protein CDH04_08190 [Francisella adeliensis]MBK2086465.1 hypothetical protein [Francisella adeliensis]MBK2096093.1 hypothetical protein [Francisella adeliensis]QIW12621.1 hypothetical protein FZC43_08195 [Francisella adeliensis]QIW14495.1 hypothetical protein FZC44_08190 [Francisella adeliensis]
MKKVLLSTVLLIPFMVFADSQDSDNHQQKFEAKKQQIITRMQEGMSCVEKATTRDELKACKPNKKGHKKNK